MLPNSRIQSNGLDSLTFADCASFSCLPSYRLFEWPDMAGFRLKDSVIPVVNWTVFLQKSFRRVTQFVVSRGRGEVNHGNIHRHILQE